ncbi:MAG: J domain-containing protein, partial [Planctomycetota bacterium]|nr:J domain-containing protein [Planctomycetota bacterium]
AAGKPPRQADDKESSGPKGRPAAGNPAPEPEPEPLRVPPPEEEVLTAADALALLGLAPAADAKAIERAFRERSLTCHPDKVAHLDREFQELAERKFRRLQRAYDLLSR